MAKNTNTREKLDTEKLFTKRRQERRNKEIKYKWDKQLILKWDT